MSAAWSRVEVNETVYMSRYLNLAAKILVMPLASLSTVHEEKRLAKILPDIPDLPHNTRHQCCSIRASCYRFNESYHCPETYSIRISAVFTYTLAYRPPHVASSAEVQGYKR